MEYKPTPYRNSNCLENWCCPDCGNEEKFEVAAMSTFTITDDGTDEFGDVEYDGNSHATCPDCGKTGTVNDFCPGYGGGDIGSGQPPMQVILLTITHKHGDNEHVCINKEAAMSHLYEYVSDEWEGEIDAEMPDDKDDAIEMYFDEMAEKEWYSLETLDVSAGAGK